DILPGMTGSLPPVLKQGESGAVKNDSDTALVIQVVRALSHAAAYHDADLAIDVFHRCGPTLKFIKVKAGAGCAGIHCRGGSRRATGCCFRKRGVTHTARGAKTRFYCEEKDVSSIIASGAGKQFTERVCQRDCCGRLPVGSKPCEID